MEKYLTAIRQNVCSICIDSDDTGQCILNDKELCALEEFLPQIVQIITDLDESGGGDYNAALKKIVCTKCRARDDQGFCSLREDVNCSLDRYFPLIVETIQKTNIT